MIKDFKISPVKIAASKKKKKKKGHTQLPKSTVRRKVKKMAVTRDISYCTRKPALYTGFLLTHLPGVIFRTWNLQETFAERKVVSNGVLHTYSHQVVSVTSVILFFYIFSDIPLFLCASDCHFNTHTHNTHTHTHTHAQTYQIQYLYYTQTETTITM